MKKLLFSAVVLAITSTVLAQPQAKKVVDVAKFASEKIDFGKIKQSVPAKGTFTITNISNAPLIIEQANPTCGCTISDYTKEPIAPGKNGVINATFNASNVGAFEKHLTVKFAGVDEMKSITFAGEVLSAEEFDKAKGTAPAASVTPAATTAPAKVKVTKTKKVKTTSTTTAAS